MNILIVDDEELILKCLQDMVNKCSDSKALAVMTVPEAMDILQGNDIHLVVTDYSLPNHGGETIAKHCLKHKIPCIVASGYTRENMTGISPETEVVDKLGSCKAMLNYITASEKTTR